MCWPRWAPRWAWDNIWLFPYRVGQYGGGAFLIPYFLFVALFSYVGLSGEFALGRLTGTGAMGSLDYVLRQRGRRGGRVLGAIPLLGVLGIAIGYSVVVGWVLRYAAGSLTGCRPGRGRSGLLLRPGGGLRLHPLALRGGGGDGRHPDLRRGLRH
ncbi:MAG: hypothetical protein ACLRWQ_15520 [Flavonifractor plautii]